VPRTVLLGVRVLDPDAPSGPAAVEVDGDRIVRVAPAGDERGDHVLHLDGAVLTAAFVDAHVHATATGLLVDGLDLTGCPSADALLDAVAARAAARPGALVWGHGWEDLGWSVPDRAALDRAAAGAPVYLSRIDVHSALVSSALLDRAPGAVGAAGWSAGALSADAHHHARRAALDAVDGRVRDAAQDAFLAAAAARGIGVVHECAGPDISSRADLAALRTRPGPDVVPYWGEAVGSADEARDLLAATGAHGLAGDLFVDGSIGSRTAALAAPYADDPGCRGNRYLDADAVAAHVAACSAAGVQAGFHVIGDAAAAVLVEGLRAAGDLRGVAHRVEHLEMVDAAGIAALAAMGVVASVQPVFDALWGGPDGLYAERLGDRWRPMNPFAALAAAGVVLALGSDAPVTPLGPWEAVRAAVAHRTPGSGLTGAAALAAHTVGGHRAAGDADPLAGRVVAGAPASYALWDGLPGDGAAGIGPAGTGAAGPSGAPRCLRTVQRGRVLHDALDTCGTMPA
jgi:predicted amidohydrolase YtcJ